MELQRLKKLCELDKPFVIEFTGTPRTGKTTIINNLFDYFKKGGFNIKLIEEFTTSKHYKEELKNKWKKLDTGERNLLILEEIYKTLTDAIKENYDIILIDRGLYDRQIWNLLRYQTGDIPEDKYFKTRDKYLEISKTIIDYLIITYTDSLTSLRRDYINSLSLEQRNFLNLDNIENYNQSLSKLQNTFTENNNMSIIDTTNISPRDASIEITSKIMPVIRKKYIDSFIKNNTTK